MSDEPARGSTIDYCEHWPEEGHSWVSTNHAGLPRVWTKRCSGCGYLDVSEVRAEVVSLTAERDQLREQLAEDDKKWDLVIDQISTASARVMRERDAALASRDTAYRALDEAERNLSAALGGAEGNLPQLVEQTARMRAVVEAAKAWEAAGGAGQSRDAWQPTDAEVALEEAVDALDAGAATGGESGDG